MTILYNYYRSTASYRVRIALNIKKLSYENVEINLVTGGGEQHKPAYHQINPQELVPTLKVNDTNLTQSLAILEYLEETVPTPALLPKNPLSRAKIRALCMIIACDMHPLNNLRVLKHVRHEFQADEAQITAWYHHWLKQGFDAIETHLQSLNRTIPVCFGDEITMADVCLIPQVYNAKRFNFSLANYPIIQSINEHCSVLNPFMNAAP
jgi:maleylacetoacetate isomerase